MANPGNRPNLSEMVGGNHSGLIPVRHKRTNNDSAGEVRGSCSSPCLAGAVDLRTWVPRVLLRFLLRVAH
jgi:hypothetical protein